MLKARKSIFANFPKLHRFFRDKAGSKHDQIFFMYAAFLRFKMKIIKEKKHITKSRSVMYEFISLDFRHDRRGS